VIVYLIRNRISGKCYIGKTTQTLHSRWRQHRTEARIGRLASPLYVDMRALGVAFFEIELLAEAECQRRLAQLERKFIAKFNAVTEGYNLTEASQGGRSKLKRSRWTPLLSDSHRKAIAASVRLSWIERRGGARLPTRPLKSFKRSA
jgi:group I intron endonuclease